jgi:hypothetical protein
MSLGPALQFADEHGRIHEHVLDAAERVSIGRSPDATIPLEADSTVSRLHAIIESVETTGPSSMTGSRVTAHSSTVSGSPDGVFCAPVTKYASANTC